MLTDFRTYRPIALLLLVCMMLGACASADTDSVTDGATEDDTAPPISRPDDPLESEDEVQPDGDGEPPVSDPAAAPAAAEEVRMTGTLGGSGIEGGCVWLDADDGERYELIAAPGGNVVIDPGNQVVASTEGEEIATKGTTIEVVGIIDPGMVSFCQVGTIMLVQDASAS